MTGSFAAFARAMAFFAIVLSAAFVMTGAASAETRTLKLYYVHTKERAEVTFKRNGKYLSDGLRKASHMTRDWRRNQPTKMDPKVFDLLWEVYKASGSRDYIHIVSGYRSPATNAMLRKTRGGQAEKSQHMVGKAIDFYIPDVKLSKLRAIALRFGAGGVGFYPRSGSPFIHIDTGSVRHWPRMTRKELIALFPDGKTLHVPTDGKPLPGYNQALAAYKSKGRSGTAAVVAAREETPARKPTLFGALFGGGEDQTEDEADSTTVAAAPPEPAPAAQSRPTDAAVEIASLQPEALDVAPDVSAAPPAAVAQALPDASPQETPEAFAGLPQNGPIPAFAPRAPAPDTQFAAADPLEPLTPADVAALDAGGASLPDAGPLPQARPEAEIAAIVPQTQVPGSDAASAADGAQGLDPLAVIAAAEPGAPALPDGAPDAALRNAFAPVPEAAPGRDPAAVALAPLSPGDAAITSAETESASGGDGEVLLAGLPQNGPVPQKRAAAPSVSAAMSADGRIGDAVDTGVKTTAKAAKLARQVKTARLRKLPPAASAQPAPSLAPLPATSQRFGQAAIVTAKRKVSDPVRTASTTPKRPAGGNVVASGTIPVSN
jgi:uncharacterized protein YcbK (DUF882 family)